VKTVAQQALTALHRTRSAWMATRTARINLVRGLLREFGIPIPVGSTHAVPRVLVLLRDPTSAVPDAIRPTLDSLCNEIRDLELRIKAVEKQLAELARDIPATKRLLSVPGIGLLTATALVAFVGDVGRFPSGRRFASYLGLTPREKSSGNIRRLGSISKRGDAYIRMLLTHGARAVLRSAMMAARSEKKLDPLRAWAVRLQQRRGHNRATIALANKLARIAWAVWKRDQPFRDMKVA
jgi:transposase